MQYLRTTRLVLCSFEASRAVARVSMALFPGSKNRDALQVVHGTKEWAPGRERRVGNPTEQMAHLDISRLIPRGSQPFRAPESSAALPRMLGTTTINSANMELPPDPASADAPILDRLTHLPVELQRKVLSELLSAETPCAFALFVPDWGVCCHATNPVNLVYDLQRTDVYTRGTGGDGGRYDSGVVHGGRDHVVFPMRAGAGSHDACALMDRLSTRFPVALDWVLRDIERDRLRVFEQVFPRAPDDGIGKCMSHGALVYGSGPGGQTGPEARVPPRHLMFNGIAKDPWFQLRLRRNPETKIGFGMRLFVETAAAAADILEVDWGVMPQLETVFLDLRSYGRGKTGEDSIRKGASKMSCLRLRCLVIAGLRSGKWYVRPPGWELCEWEADDREADGGVNWVKVFCGAVREGGRLIFVDQRIADVDWRGWRGKAEREGLLPVVEEEPQLGESGEAAYLRHVERVMG